MGPRHVCLLARLGQPASESYVCYRTDHRRAKSLL